MIDFPASPTVGQSFTSANGIIYTWDGVAWNLTGSGFDRWATRGIGEIYMVNTALAGVEIPPATTDATIWIELTAGLTGAGAFNSGKLTTESVSGSAPLVLATAVISFSGSPMNGQTVDLINTENRILRPSTTAGAKQNDAFQSHLHSYNAGTSNTNNQAITGSAPSGTIQSSAPVVDGANGTPRTANETRMKNVGVKAYMRIK